ncbi:hypothetical protein [Streptomyces albidoflavus]
MRSTVAVTVTPPADAESEAGPQVEADRSTHIHNERSQCLGHSAAC